MTKSHAEQPSQDVLRGRLKDSLGTIRSLRARVQELSRPQPLAVIGLSCRLPGGGTPEEFWQSLADGRDSTSRFPEERHSVAGFYNPDPDHPGTAYTLSGNFLDGPVDAFDPTVFGISPREAAGMDPQQRLVLELAWEAMENACLPPSELEGSRVGVFLGASTSDYVRMRQQKGSMADVDAYQLIGEPSFLAGRISYTFGFQGPSMVIDTACSSSLVALEQAVLSLRSGACDTALVGGVNLMLSPYGFVLVSKLRALSPDGRCKTFDAAADGYARGEGGALFVLKRLSEAEAAGDRVLAVVRGVATEHDGRSSGLTVPNPAAQQNVITSALKDAGVSPADLTYVEAHGTGTQLGDPIELKALDAVTSAGRPAERPLLVGSVKTNIGHLEPAAGAAGLLKVVLALQHDTLPRHLHLDNPNPQVPWDAINLKVTRDETAWPDGPRIAGVSSFGASGTNAHTVLAEAPQPAPREGAPRRVGLLTLSANSPEALRAMASAYERRVREADPRTLSDVCYSSHIGRARMKHGLSVTGDAEQLAAGLAAFAVGERADQVTAQGPAGAKARRLGWLFTGQGSQYAGMAASLADTEPVFANALAQVVEALDRHLDEPLGPVLSDGERINRTGFTQPALFAVEYALARMWESWGIRPTALIGHSLGEITAACVAGVHSLDDAARLVTARARLMEALPEGGVMETAVCDEETVREAIADAGPVPRVAVAAVNGPTDVVLSGPEDEISRVVDVLAGRGVKHRRLVVSHAFHSPLMAPMTDEFRKVTETLTFHHPKYPIISNVTGRAWGPEQLRPAYWCEHVLAPVRFHAGVTALYETGCRTFLEIGPAPVLLGLGARCLPEDGVGWIPSLRRDREDAHIVGQALGALHHRGVPVDWNAVHRDERPRRTSLPSYPWQRERYWFNDDARGGTPEFTADDAPGTLFEGHLLSGAPTFSPRLEDLSEVFVHTGPDGRRSVSAGGFCHWALAGAAKLPGAQPRLVDRFVVGEPLLLDLEHRPARIRVYVLPQEDEGRSLFLCFSRQGVDSVESGSWRLHARGVLVRRPAETRHAGGDLEAVRARCLPVDPADLTVPGWAEPVLDKVYQGPGEVLAEVNRAAEDLPRGALLDLTLGLLRQSEKAPEAAGTPVPRAVPEGSRRYVHGWLDPAEEDGELRGGLEILGSDGSVLIMMRDVHLRSSTPVAQEVPRSAREETVWEQVWRPAGPEAFEERSLTGERVLLVGSGGATTGTDTGLLGSVTERLTLRGAVVSVAEPSPEAVLEALEEGRPYGHLVLLSALDLPVAGYDAESVGQARAEAEHVFLAAARRLAVEEAATQLWVVTCGAQWTGPEQREICLPAAPLWGLGKVAALEQPELWGGLLDLDPAGEADEAELIAALLATRGAEDLTARRGGTVLVPRLVAAATGDEHTGRTAPRLSDLGSYLVTGGLGSLGLLLGEWLAGHGAGTVVLAGRSGLPHRSTWDDPHHDDTTAARIAGVRRIEAQGADVRVVALDAADETALRSLTDQLGLSGRPLRGVVHAAGLSEPQFLRESDPATYDRCLHAKVDGTWALHNATIDQDLDLFVSFSSIASVWGSQHLAGYSAANAFLDSFAYYRQRQGLCATTVSWGPWAARSGLADDSVMAFLRSIGLHQLNPEHALELLGEAVAEGVAHRTVCSADWTLFRDLMEARRERPILSEIRSAPAAARAGGSEPVPLTARLIGLGRTERLAELNEYVRVQLSGILRMELDTLTEDTRLADMGLDSLMVMELISRCRDDLGLAVNSRDFFACPGINWGSFLHGLIEERYPAATAAPGPERPADQA
ncbi:beta-ketoacyl synthase N-terminal-like domain-containing protein [Streptomyces sp. NPDC086182]|uniref:beta-ketoacyl synthase N-terminal-like domain-containing protein n=1 Tax=Streptomyces sp. NPDC086182 TaxID=3155058 RepID=UPI0034357C64